MTNTYAKAYTEVLEILNHFSKEEYSKIPQEKIDFYKNNMDKEYNYKIIPEKDLSKQYISKEANAILISLFRDYFANKNQKRTLKNLLNQNKEKNEKEKHNRYSTDNIFKKNANQNQINEKVEETKQLIEYKESVMKKFFKKILKILHIEKIVKR